MFANSPPIYFYIPRDKLNFDDLPSNANAYWQWLGKQRSISPMQGGGNIWTLQTYLQLHDAGFPCQLVAEMPDEGIVISHRDYLEDSFQPGSRVMLVCLRADVDRHPYAQLHVVQNPHQVIPKSSIELWESHFIPHWPQPAIIPRDPNRGDTFENVTFLGNETNLVPEFRGSDWLDRLQDLGLKFQTKLHHHEWPDYSSTDVILAIRSMGVENEWKGKPASKLYNAWHSGVPAILGYESAFRAERQSDLDYIEATSLEEVISALSQLRDHPQLRDRMAENGRQRNQETKPEVMVGKWQDFLTKTVVPAYQDWCAMTNWQQQLFLKARRSFISLRPTYYRLKRSLTSTT